jgi:DNA-binding NarL/FixJ family response regulator
MNTKIVIYEDNHDLRESIAVLLHGTAGFEVLATFPNCKDIEAQVTKFQPDVVLMDIDMPIKNGLEGLKIIHEKYPAIDVIMLTVFESNEYIFDAIRAGAVGYLLKKSSPLEIINAIKEVQDGGSPMTPIIARKVLQFFPHVAHIEEKNETESLSEREIEVLKLLTKGFTYRMAAYELSIGVETIRTYIKRIYAKLHVHSNTEAVAVALQKKIIAP